MKVEGFARLALEGMSLKDLEALLADLKKDEARITGLIEANPELAKLKRDDGLKATEYRIWQSIKTLSLTKDRIANINLAIEQKQKKKVPTRKKSK